MQMQKPSEEEKEEREGEGEREGDKATLRKSNITKPSNAHTAATTLVPTSLDLIDDGFDDIASNSTLATNLRTDPASYKTTRAVAECIRPSG